MDVDWRKENNAPVGGTVICALDDLQEGVAKEFSFGDQESFRLLLYRHEDQIVAFVNRCPHHWIPMNQKSAAFTMWDADNHELMCIHHTAVFKLLDGGRCINGPCKSSNLIQVPVILKNSEIVVSEVGRDASR